MTIVATTRTPMRYFIYLILLISTSIHAGGIKKWTDAEGNVYYGDSPPVNVTTQEVKVTSAPSNTGKALPRLNASDSTETSTDEPGPDKVPADQAKAACDIAREDLSTIKGNKRIKLKSADGTTRYMTTEEIAERRKKAEEDVKSFCR
ncbi:MAG: DUF4124 domain-containing protein [Gammaproteobacteria bacterium]|nr:DUF4124 domain-containing protein [Gammaproteobacteria bacterium]